MNYACNENFNMIFTYVNCFNHFGTNKVYNAVPQICSSVYFVCKSHTLLVLNVVNSNSHNIIIIVTAIHGDVGIVKYQRVSSELRDMTISLRNGDAGIIIRVDVF